jgi:threonine dehydrogenase-like Zn-dependent dehydrogenase
VQIVDRPVPQLGPKEALVKTAVATICHTDSYILSGTHPFATYPVTPGHEFSGVVAAVGSEVTNVIPGTRVAVRTLVSCERCRFCQRGDTNLCESLLELGSLLPGGYEEYVVAPASGLHPIADHFSLEEAALTEPSANAHAVVRRAEIEAGDTVAVIGPGPIGLLALQYARLKQPARLILIGTPSDGRRLEIGLRLGATDARSSPTGVIADRVLQCAGTLGATQLALAMAGVNATVVIEGVVASSETIPVSPDEVLLKQLTIRGTRGWTTRDFVSALQTNQSGTIDLRGLITHRFSLEEYETAFRMTADYTDGVIKAAFVFAP